MMACTSGYGSIHTQHTTLSLPTAAGLKRYDGMHERIRLNSYAAHHSITAHSLEELAAGNELLGDHSGHGNHRKPSVVDLLGLHLLQRRRIRGLEAEGIEHEVATLALLARRKGVLDLPGVVDKHDREELDDADRSDDSFPAVLQRGGLIGDVGGHVDVTAEERVEVLTNDEAEGSKHGHAAVLDLNLTIVVDLARGKLVRQAERIEEAERACSRQRLRVGGAGLAHHERRGTRRHRRRVRGREGGKHCDRLYVRLE